MTQAIDPDIRDIKSAIDANSKAISELAQEVRLGFTKLEGKIDNLDTKLTGRIDTLEAKFEERTKGFGQRLDGKELAQRNVSTGLTVAIVGGLLLTLAKYLFFGTTSP
jgi:hypothetical protein